MFLKTFRKNKTRKAYTLLELSAVAMIISVFISVVAIGGTKLTNSIRLVRARAITASSPVKDISNLAIWLETTSKKSFIQSELIGTSPTISTWYDINPQTVTKVNATQATQAQQPTYIANFTNGLPALYFYEDELFYNKSFLYSTSYTAFLVEARNADFSYQITSVDGTANTSLEIRYELTNLYWIQQNGGTPMIGGVAVPSFTIPIPRIHTVINARAKGARQYLNGSLVASTSNPADITQQGSSANARIGCFCYQHSGYIMEYIVFTRDLTDPERQDVESYLSKKWKIAL